MRLNPGPVAADIRREYGDALFEGASMIIIARRSQPRRPAGSERQRQVERCTVYIVKKLFG
jgi:hypothetical protein